LTTAEIAKAFLVPEATMAQRISGAKQSIKDSRHSLSTADKGQIWRLTSIEDRFHGRQKLRATLTADPHASSARPATQQLEQGSSDVISLDIEARVKQFLLRRDFTSLIERSFYELNPQTRLLLGPHIEVIATKLEACRQGRARRMPTEAGAKSVTFSVELTRDTVETVEVTTVSTSRAQPGY
jgi:hypothetical protein